MYLRYLWLCGSLMLFTNSVLAQNLVRAGSHATTSSLTIHHFRPSSSSDSTFRTAAGFDPGLAPFYHGVASGDPLPRGVVLWTRVTPPGTQDTAIEVSWRIAKDTAMRAVVQQGTFITDHRRDYTVKVEVGDLQPGQHYYYEFSALGRNSLRGRTKTAPAGPVDHLRFAVVSCSNYEAGYFHAYGNLAERNDLDAVIHLGDYIYEYPTGYYGNDALDRKVNASEAANLGGYRARYSLYRLDPELRRAHQQHPFIPIWDDHESANDAWEYGAQNHQPNQEGAWTLRKSEAKQAYFEWLPIRDRADTTIYRRLSYGDLMDLVMLDTRLEARDKQILDVTDPGLYAPDRTMLGPPQKDWFFQELKASQATWKVVGNQVIFSPFHIAYASRLSPSYTAEGLEGIFMDIWDGYPAERREIIRAIEAQELQDLVFLTGDFHCSFAFEVADSVNDPDYRPIPGYDPATGAGAVAVEFATPSISSANFDENLSPGLARILERSLNRRLFPLVPRVPNPHMKYVDLDRHGYTLLDVKADTVRANWYYVNGLGLRDTGEYFGHSLFITRGSNHLRYDGAESRPKAEGAASAPLQPRQAGAMDHSYGLPVVFGMSSGEVFQQVHVHLGLGQPQAIRLALIDPTGKVLTPSAQPSLAPGVYDLSLPVDRLPAGKYQLELQVAGQSYRRWVKVRN